MPDPFEELEGEPDLDETDNPNPDEHDNADDDQTPDGITDDDGGDGEEGEDFSDFDNIDPKKLAPELQALYKKMQAGLTKKFQEMSEREKLILQAAQNKPTEAPRKKTIYDLFDEKPSETIKDINAHIKKLKANEDTDPAEIDKWQELKEELLTKSLEKGKAIANAQSAFSEAERQVLDKIPNFRQKVPHLYQFAGKEFNLTNEEVNYLTNPTIHGPIAVKMVLLVNKVFDRLKAGKTIQGKERREPTRVETAGKGFINAGSKKVIGEDALRERALKSRSVDDFAALIAARRQRAQK